MKDLLDLVRGFVRPVVTVMVVLAVIVMLFTGVIVPEWYVALLGSIVGFWFASRSPTNGNSSPP